MRRAITRFALVCAAALAVAGCKNPINMLEGSGDSGMFSKPLDVFAKPAWVNSSTVDDKNAQLSLRGPVAPEELVGADGSCGAPAAPAAPEAAPASAAPADRPVGSVAGDLASAPMPASANPTAGRPDQPPGAPQFVGGVGLGMSECDVVRRAGLPGNVNISAGDKGDRKVVLTYLSGTWPGIYTFDAGRLKEVSRAPVPPAATKPVKKQKAKKPTKPKSAAN